jgi:DNA-damage-inducible protein J
MKDMSSVTVRVDAATKDAATKILEGLGLDLSTATRAFYRQVVLQRRLPFDVAYPNETLLPEIEARFDTAEDQMAAGTATTYASTDELFGHLGV